MIGFTYSRMGLVHPHSQPVLDMLHCQILTYALQLLARILVICMLAQTEQVSRVHLIRNALERAVPLSCVSRTRIVAGSTGPSWLADVRNCLVSGMQSSHVKTMPGSCTGN